MLRALLTGLRLTTRQWRLGLVLWLVSAGFGVGFAAVTGYWLSESLAGSLPMRTLLHELDADVFVDLLFHHGESLRMVLVAAMVLAVIYVGLWFWFHAAIVVAVQGRGDAGLPEAFLRGVERTPLMARLFAVATVVLAVFSLAVGLPAWWLIRATFAQPSELITYHIAAAGAAVWALGYIALVAIHDHARLRACAAHGRALPAYAWAARFVLSGGAYAYPLALALQLIGAAGWLLYGTLPASVPATNGVTVAALFLWGELFLLLRMWLRVWFFAAQNELQSPR